MSPTVNEPATEGFIDKSWRERVYVRVLWAPPEQAVKIYPAGQNNLADPALPAWWPKRPKALATLRSGGEYEVTRRIWLTGGAVMVKDPTTMTAGHGDDELVNQGIGTPHGAKVEITRYRPTPLEQRIQDGS